MMKTRLTKIVNLTISQTGWNFFNEKMIFIYKIKKIETKALQKIWNSFFVLDFNCKQFNRFRRNSK